MLLQDAFPAGLYTLSSKQTTDRWLILVPREEGNYPCHEPDLTRPRQVGTEPLYQRTLESTARRLNLPPVVARIYAYSRHIYERLPLPSRRENYLPFPAPTG
jgi:hypothetical protein